MIIQFRELFKAGRINSLQVTQFETSLYNQQQSLLNARVNYQNALDRFKVLIGLPPSLEVVLEDDYLDRFNLIDDLFPQRLEELTAFRAEISVPLLEFSRGIRKQEALAKNGGDLATGDEALRELSKALIPSLKRSKEFVKSIMTEDREVIEKDIDRLDRNRKDRLAYLLTVKEDIESGKVESQVEPSVFEDKSIPTKEELLYQLKDKENKLSLLSLLSAIEQETDSSIERLEMFTAGDGEQTLEYYEGLEKEVANRIPDLLTELNGIVLEMALLQVAARSNIINITNVNIDPTAAFETARCFRRDWMNARAALVDRWRQIEFFADQLESQVDLVLTGEIGNANADNPFRIRYEDGNLRAGFRFDAPIVRQVERNAYRQAQIAYQQSRRSFYQFEDAISQSLRFTLRTINQNKVLFELNRRTVQVSLDNVKQARAELVRPPRPGQTGAQANTTALFLANAINGLNGVQNGYLRQWTQYEVLRRNLDFDMGTMQLDENFEWIDPGEIDATIGSRVAMLEGVAENDRFCCGMHSAQMETQYVTPADGMSSSDNEIIEQPPVESDAPQLQYEGDSIEIDTQEEIETPKPPANLTDPTDDDPLTLPLGKKRLRAMPESAATGANPVSAKGFLDPFRRRAPVEGQQKKPIATKNDKTVGLISVTPSTKAVSSVFDATAPSAREVLKQRTAKVLDVKIRRR